MSDQGLLLINLGSPASPTPGDVRSYLNQFLMDPHVIDLPWPVRRLLVSLILLKRPKESAEAYRQIWSPQGSPLVVISQQLAARVREQWQHGPVELGMRYGEPSIESALRKLVQQGATRIVLAPLYPQFADSTTTTALQEVHRVIARHGLAVKVRSLPAFYAEPAYIEALAASLQPALEQPFDHLLFSFHGLPERHLTKLDTSASHCLQSGDCCDQPPAAVLAHCYRAQCLLSARLTAQAAGLQDHQWSVAFQSRLGRAKWIEPYTESRLDELAAAGCKKLLVISPAFVADCVETLEELGIRAREQFLTAGGQQLELVPCLNQRADWAQALTQLCEAQL